jgi:magnesium transporter
VLAGVGVPAEGGSAAGVPGAAPVVRAWQLMEGRVFAPLPDPTPQRGWSGDRVLRWVDVQTVDAEAFGAVLLALGASPALVAQVTDQAADLSDAGAEREAAWLRVPVPTALAEEGHRFITLVALPSVLVTHHRRPLATLDQLEALLLRAIPEGGSSAALVLEVVEEFAAAELRAYMAARRDVDQLALQLDETPEAVSLDQVSALMRQVDRLSAVCEDHLLALSLLPQLESQAFGTVADRGQLAEVTRTLERYQYGLKRLERRLEGVRALYSAGLQERANQRLRVLTVMSTVFLPLTLLASIYGMNFAHMPELQSRLGYPLVLGAMVVIAAVQVWWYRRQGWWG